VREVFDLRNVNWTKLHTTLQSVPWDDFYINPVSPSLVLDNWLSLFNETIHSIIPVRRIKITARDKPWITPFVKHYIQSSYGFWKVLEIGQSVFQDLECLDN
jgi:hypothetical protein